jgi:hypothetical protein
MGEPVSGIVEVGIKPLLMSAGSMRPIAVRVSAKRWMHFMATKWEVRKDTGILYVEYMVPDPDDKTGACNREIYRYFSPNGWLEVSTDLERRSEQG